MAYTQTNNLIRLDTPTSYNLLLRQFTGEEGISRLFAYELGLQSPDAEIKFEDMIGKNVTVRLHVDANEERFFNGYISSFRLEGQDPGLPKYHATMVPWLWFLSRTSDCRIFQNLSIPDVIQKVFVDLGFHDFKINPKNRETYEKKEYCVQYGETDLNFVCRLMEQEGLFYYFEHEEKRHVLVISDMASVHQPLPGQPELRWYPEGTGILDEAVIKNLTISQEFRPGKCVLSDYNFETPKTSLLTEVDTTNPVANSKQFEMYHYPGKYRTKADGEALATVRMQEEETQRCEVHGASNCRVVASGYRFKLKKFFRQDLNIEYLVTHVQHSVSVGTPYVSQAEQDEQNYENRFVCIPYSTPFRPKRVTPIPVIQGPQTALVVGAAGKEIDVDDMGRVKVQFFWDREGKKDENSSCWIPVSQVHAGKGFGAVDIPRIGEEVIVGFIEGDPDAPIIIGRVYNGHNMPPNGLPKSGMISGMKSNTTPGGGGFNSIMLDDSKGKEAITIHGQYNMSTTVKNDHSLTVTSGNDTHTVSAGTQTVTVKGKTSLTVQAGDRVVNVTGNYKCDTTSEINLQAPTKITLTCGGSTITMEPGKIVLKAGGGASLTLDGDALMVASGGGQVLVNADVNAQSSGGSSLTLDGNAKMSGAGEATVEGSTKSTFCGGGATVVSDAIGVAATGPKISLNG